MVIPVRKGGHFKGLGDKLEKNYFEDYFSVKSIR